MSQSQLPLFIFIYFQNPSHHSNSSVSLDHAKKKKKMASNRKSYLLSLLLLFLLVNTCVAGIIPNLGRFLKPLYKELQRELPKEAAGAVWQIANSPPEAPRGGSHLIFSPPPPDSSSLPQSPPSPEEIQWVKQYLNNYGYLEDYPNNEYATLDPKTTSAIMDYQNFFNLTRTGKLDPDTHQKMLLLRCGVPDVNFKYDLSTTNNVSWPLGIEWFPNGTNLTYGFAPGNDLPGEIIKVFEDSFKRWSEAIGLVNLTETTYDDADIKIGFRVFSNDILGWEVVGGTVIEMQTSDNDDDFQSLNNDNNNNNKKKNVKFGSMILVGTKLWAPPSYSVSNLWKDGVVDLETVVMHQIGHLLGFEHSSDKDSVMHPYILPSMPRKVELSADDRNNIQKLYYPSFNSGSGVVGSGLGPLLITTWSLGFACMVLLV